MTFPPLESQQEIIDCMQGGILPDLLSCANLGQMLAQGSTGRLQ